MQGADMLRNVEDAIIKNKLFEAGESIVVAFSGGPDSAAMLHILNRLSEKWGWTLTAAHINHGLREEESDEEESFAAQFCADLGVRFWSTRLRMKEHEKEHGNNVQAAARTLRYEALRKAAAEVGTSTVALGHHADDQAETVLMRMLRGTGPGGLAGIRPKREAFGLKLVRPLLRITKSDLMDYCRVCGVPFRIDSSNESDKYFRNAIRLNILPYLMKHREGVSEALSRLAIISADESDLLDLEAGALVERLAVRTDRGVKIDRLALLNIHVALQRRMFKIILNCLNAAEASIDFPKLERMREAIAADSPPHMELRLTEALYFRRSYNDLVWTNEPAQSSEPYEYIADVVSDGKLAIVEADAHMEWSVRAAAETGSDLQSDHNIAIFDADLAGERWIVRSRKPGDKLEPYGLKGSKKVKDMFIDLKVPLERRDRWPLVTDESGTILWIPGLRRSKHAAVSNSSKKVVIVRFQFGIERDFET